MAPERWLQIVARLKDSEQLFSLAPDGGPGLDVFAAICLFTLGSLWLRIESAPTTGWLWIDYKPTYAIPQENSTLFDPYDFH
jgi:hypothetical protein